MRQSGRTSRTVDFVVDQLYQCGQAIATDHIAFEYKISMAKLENFITKVIDRINSSSYGSLKVEYNIQKVNDIYVVHFRTVRTVKTNKDDTK